LKPTATVTWSLCDPSIRRHQSSIDRLCMMLPGQESIRNVIHFPQLKPK
jgi:hypothetical protein